MKYWFSKIETGEYFSKKSLENLIFFSIIALVKYWCYIFILLSQKTNGKNTKARPSCTDRKRACGAQGKIYDQKSWMGEAEGANSAA